MTSFLSLNQLILEIDPALKQTVWEKSQKAATPLSCWQTYLDRLTLDTFSNYVLEEQTEIVTTEKKLRTIGELVNGISIRVGNTKIVLISSEAEDLAELRVPQEWVDIPQWIADYYIAVQIDPDDDYLRLWGYTTHQQLKNKGDYDFSDRSYSLDSSDLIEDINALWVARELCPNEVTKADISPIKEINNQQAKNLIQRLGKAENLLPRLSIPFTQWAALISQDNWRDELIALRRGENKFSVLKWLKTELSDVVSEIGWRQVEWQLNTEEARGKNATTIIPNRALAKQLTINQRNYELKVIPIEADTLGFELSSLSVGGMIPQGFTLRLLTENGEEFPGNEDVATTAVESLSLKVALDPGEGLIWEIEPTPEDYRSQVLYF